MHQTEDTYLIEQILAGNTRAFGDLVDQYQVRVYNFVLNILRNEEDAHEVVQDTFLKVYKSLNTFRGESKLSTWMLRIAYFACMTRLRKVKPVLVDIENHSSSFEGNNVHDQAELGDMRSVLAQALEGLTEDEKGIVTLYYYNDQSIKEICEIMGLKDSNVKIILHRSRKKMSEVLRKVGITEWVS
ncbi:RNA polymerase sigma factor [Marinoscillum pacificum]|uniref:RNA polymerase sigma factor n=1 Tax=Marinoscillum pacificum TaxID=392723 RepID=UPI0021584C7E|nr:RNA polymerase sigma factor [Marinoscillum pacificum]